MFLLTSYSTAALGQLLFFHVVLIKKVLNKFEFPSFLPWEIEGDVQRSSSPPLSYIPRILNKKHHDHDLYLGLEFIFLAFQVPNSIDPNLFKLEGFVVVIDSDASLGHFSCFTAKITRLVSQQSVI